MVAFAILLLTLFSFQAPADDVRVGDIATVAGARDNQLNGFGLVVGLAGDGDKDPIYTQKSIANMLQRYGINVQSLVTQISAKNVAVVIVTADIPAFAKPGARIDVQVSSMGDAKSLQGGVLLQTPLMGADNKVYAVAQGPIAVGGFTVGNGGGGGASVTKNFPTVGQIIGGAIVEKEIPTTIVCNNNVELLLRNPSFISAALMADAINNVFANSAQALDATSVRVHMPEGTQNDLVSFIARLDDVEMTPDVPARVIINERTGTIVATSNIHISSCAVACGNITISISSTPSVSQPAPFSRTGSTVLTSQTTTQVTENKTSMVALPELPTVEQVATALNSLGVTPRDMMAIFQAMKQAGALQAELDIR
ncbi:MAG TPA: flagellar basal body P-ring protein FlgI [Verrucomicrobiae bacterium]|nr:flagellar basal body P-ring protein FlgI [Verrucomicrobiae bacterium]